MATKVKFDRVEWSRRRIVKRPGRNKFLTGFCGNGHCEGTQPISPSGKGIKTCPLFLTCPCVCHKELDDMFEITGEIRELVENPKYTKIDNSKLMTMLDDIRRDSIVQRRLETSRNSESLLPSAYDDSVTDEDILSGKAFKPTVSGVRAKGQLEYQVLAACLEAVATFPEGLEITPKWIATLISAHENISEPSTGAIQAVWDRWVKMGFATYEHKPVRFGSFTEAEPTRASLEDARIKFKQQNKSVANQLKRTTIKGQRT